ncbi:MAG TPA: polyphenol oxidase family protein [Solirubrobacteraceae bacterium]|nr:polyphenol oxidase family protein [Solirubrobacteraceae bacterium]
MTPPDPFYAFGEHLAIDLDGARVVFTTRRGGFSSGPYESLNLGRLTADRPEDVQRNRAALKEQLGVQIAYIRQVHGNAVRRVVAPPVEPTGTVELPECDGQATALPGVAPMVMTADCLPVAVAGPGAVAMLHAGWRGLDGGILAEGVDALRELGAGSPLHAAIGPGAGPCCYEVGEEVHNTFAAQGLDIRNGRNLDLKAITRQQLERAGVEVVHDVGLCTICGDPTLLFSHRRDGGVTGRQAGVVWLNR